MIQTVKEVTMAADTTRPLPGAETPIGVETINRIFDIQKHAFANEPAPSKKVRSDRLDALIRAISNNEDKIVTAVNSDFTSRSRFETVISEIVVSISAAKHAKKHLGKWMRPRHVATPIHMLPAKSRIEPQPLGVVGIISPWNYPIQLALSPAAAALAAGNRVMIKPSELTPATSEILYDILRAEFDEDVMTVIVGGVETGQAFTETPFDHLLFTGSTNIGRKVAVAAAKNLTPVTLELGGKSPAIIDESADISKAAHSIAHGKTFNAGQTCVAPDYVLTPKSKLRDTVDALEAEANALYPSINDTDDYTAIISDRHFARLKSLVDDARDRGAEIVEIGSANSLHEQRKIPLTLVVNPPKDCGIMQEEIFGPILPILSIENSTEAIDVVNAGDRPLALYWFGEDTTARDNVLSRTIAGGVTINDTLWHVAQEFLPFGGVGASGQGAYHGDAGFETFSHMKPVFYQSKFANATALHPPFSSKTESLINVVRKIL